MLVRRATLFLAAIGLAVSLTAARPAEAATKITIVATGTVEAGYDTDGSLTGAAAPDLTGLTATLTMILTETPGAIIEGGPPNASAFFSLATVAIVVGEDGPIVTLSAPSDFPTVGYFLNESGGILASGEFAGSPFFSSAFVAYNDSGFAFLSIFDEFTLVAEPDSGWGFGAARLTVDFSDPENPAVSGWEFVATPTAITISVEHAVPAPAAAGLFLVGLAGLALARRRR
jgi:hypothetical protein